MGLVSQLGSGHTEVCPAQTTSCLFSLVWDFGQYLGAFLPAVVAGLCSTPLTSLFMCHCSLKASRDHHFLSDMLP